MEFHNKAVAELAKEWGKQKYWDVVIDGTRMSMCDESSVKGWINYGIKNGCKTFEIMPSMEGK